MNSSSLDIVILGLTITSSWGNGHAVTYRALMSACCDQGHRVLFLERDKPWYADNRDLPHPPYGETALYTSLEELKDRFGERVRRADLVIVGSYVPDGRAVIDWVQERAEGATAFYDIDTPLTLARLREDNCDYLTHAQIRRFDLVLSFTGGPTLARLERDFGAQRARPLYCSVDPAFYYPEDKNPETWHLGYMGTYSPDRQAAMERLLLEPARRWAKGRFCVVGPLYPEEIEWPRNVERVDHLPPTDHRIFYNHQRFTLNLTRSDMVQAGYSPSVRLFEAGACAAPVISDFWEGLDTFFLIGREILISQSPEDTLNYLMRMPEDRYRAIGERARTRVLAEHTSMHRAEQLATYALETLNARAAATGRRG